MKKSLSYLDAKAAYEINIKTLTSFLEYDYAMDANSIIEHTKIVTRHLNTIAKNIEKAAKARLDQLQAEYMIHLKRGET